MFFRRELLEIKDDDLRVMIQTIIEEIQNSPKFTAMGFYTVEKSTLTATLGTIITYFIILYQTITCENKA